MRCILLKDWFQRAQTLASSHTRKVLSSWTWDACFFFNSHLLMFQLSGFCCKSSSICWLLPYPFRAVPQSYRRGCPPGIRPQKVCWIKHNSQLLGCPFLFSRHDSLDSCQLVSFRHWARTSGSPSKRSIPAILSEFLGVAGRRRASVQFCVHRNLHRWWPDTPLPPFLSPTLSPLPPSLTLPLTGSFPQKICRTVDFNVAVTTPQVF